MFWVYIGLTSCVGTVWSCVNVFFSPSANQFSFCFPQPGIHHLANWTQLQAITTLWKISSQIGRIWSTAWNSACPIAAAFLAVSVYAHFSYPQDCTKRPHCPYASICWVCFWSRFERVCHHFMLWGIKHMHWYIPSCNAQCTLHYHIHTPVAVPKPWMVTTTGLQAALFGRWDESLCNSTEFLLYELIIVMELAVI